MLNATWVAALVAVAANLIFIGWQGAQWATKADLETLEALIKIERKERIDDVRKDFDAWKSREKDRFDQYIAVWNDGKANRYTSLDAHKDWQLQKQVDKLQDERAQARYDSLIDRCSRLEKNHDEVRHYLKDSLGWESGKTK